MNYIRLIRGGLTEKGRMGEGCDSIATEEDKESDLWKQIDELALF